MRGGLQQECGFPDARIAANQNGNAGTSPPPQHAVSSAMPELLAAGGVSLVVEWCQHHRCAAARAQRFNWADPRHALSLLDRVPLHSQASKRPDHLLVVANRRAAARKNVTGDLAMRLSGREQTSNVKAKPCRSRRVYSAAFGGSSTTREYAPISSGGHHAVDAELWHLMLAHFGA